MACGIFLDQGSNPCPLHWQADSQPLRQQGSPRILYWEGFVLFFSPLNILASCLVPPTFLMRSLLIIYLRIPYMWQVISLLLLSRFFVFSKFDYNVSQSGPLWVHLTWSLLSFLDVYIHVFHQTCDVFSYYFLKYSLHPFLSFFSFWDSQNAYVGLLVVSHRSLRPYLLFFNLFFCFSALIISIFLSSWLILSSAFESSSEILIPMIVLLVSEFLSGSFLGFLFIVISILFMHFLDFLQIFFSLSIFKTTFKSLCLVYLPLSLFSDRFCWFIFSFERAIFCFFVCLVIFCWTLDLILIMW